MHPSGTRESEWANCYECITWSDTKKSKRARYPKCVVTLYGVTEWSPLHREESWEKTNLSAAADLAGIFADVVTLQAIVMQSTLVFYRNQAPLCLVMTFRWPRGDCVILDNLPFISERLWDDLEMI